MKYIFGLVFVFFAECVLAETFTVAELQQKLAAGEVSSIQLVERSLAAIERQSSLNTFITVDASGARSKAKQLDELRTQGHLLGPLHGIPIAVKDNIHVAGMPNTAGTPALKSFVPSQDAAVIARLKAAGAIIIGKNNMHELAFGITSDNRAFGAVGNAHNAEYIAGGSSGGTAVSIATGMVTLGVGTDTGGSSRIPAALNGIAGFRPSSGRYPVEGMTRISNTRDTAGPMAHSIADIKVLDAVLSGEASSTQTVALSGLRLGVAKAYFYQNLEPAVAEQTELFLQALQRAGVEIVEVDIDGLAELNEKVGFPLVIYESRQLLINYLTEYLPGTSLTELVEKIASPDVMSVMGAVQSAAITELEYRAALTEYRPQLQRAYQQYFRTNKLDGMIYPTTPLTARPIANSIDTVELNGKQVPTFASYIHNTDPSSNAGIPGLTLPLAMATNGMPIGIEIDGPEGSDQRLLEIGAAVETLLHNATE